MDGDSVPRGLLGWVFVGFLRRLRLLLPDLREAFVLGKGPRTSGKRLPLQRPCYWTSRRNTTVRRVIIQRKNGNPAVVIFLTWYIRRHSIKRLARLDGEEADGTFALVFGWIEPFNLRRAQGPSERLKGINNCTILDLNFLLGIPREDCGGDEADEHDPREVSQYRLPRG